MAPLVLTGGCLCGALRYEARGEPRLMGLCCCADCRKASGSGFMPFMGLSAGQLRFTGASVTFASPAASGTIAIRNACPRCRSLVFGGEVGVDDSFTIYAGSLDDPALFRPEVAIFVAGKPDWVVLPEGLRLFDRLPGEGRSG